MKLYGIFDQNYKLLKYSTDAQAEKTYTYTDPISKSIITIIEICLPDIEYSEDYIGKVYNVNTKLFQ